MRSQPAEGVVTTLRSHPLFRQLPKGWLQFLATSSSVCWFKPGHLIFREGESAGVFYLIQIGEVALEFFLTENALFTLETLGEGDILGWSWLFPPYRWHLNARALKRVQAIAFDAEKVRKKMADDPAGGLQLIQQFSGIIFKRLQAARRRLAQMAAKK